MSDQANKVAKVISQLVGDISRLPSVELTPSDEQQLVQLLTDAFEQVGHISLEGMVYEQREDGLYPTRIASPGSELFEPLYAKHGKRCGCDFNQSCHICLPLPGGITF